MSNGYIVGIDLGTTNSALALVQGQDLNIIPLDGEDLLPSVVAFDPQDNLLIGTPANNQFMLYPERTARSIKRSMGEERLIDLGAHHLSPVEVSALILRRLKVAAERYVQAPIHRAVITVPAYFGDAQRTATREAGEVAGFEVAQIINEPTAAALCYLREHNETQQRTILVYDLGGGTFDVSIVRARGRVSEVLASHGDTRLGGDDFDQALVALFRRRFIEAHGLDPVADENPAAPQARARLLRAAEEAKIRLSSRASTWVAVEHLALIDGVSRHLELELTRAEYEALIEPWIQRTRDSVQNALQEARLFAHQLDEVVLVGGATRTPRVQAMLREVLGREARSDVDPDKAVALGAALQAARLAGDRSQRVLVDITPFALGTQVIDPTRLHLGSFAYSPIIPRSTPLPALRQEDYQTAFPGQKRIAVSIYHGDSEDVRNNTLLGSFSVEDLNENDDEPIHFTFTFRLDLDGILHAEVLERETGRRKSVTIRDAFRKLSKDALVTARARVMQLMGKDGQDWDFAQATEDYIHDQTEAHTLLPDHLDPHHAQPPADLTAAERQRWNKALDERRAACALIQSGQLTPGDVDELTDLIQQLDDAIEAQDIQALEQALSTLTDVIFYLQG